jgi:hypothetical protein
LLIAQKVKYGNQDLLNQFFADVIEEQKMLQGFAAKLNG